jgi:hypothetical protein
MRHRGIRRRRDGSYAVHLDRNERDLLRLLPAQLRGAIGSEDPSTKRLFPPAHEHDPGAEGEYRALVGRSLATEKLAALSTFEETAGEERLTEEQLTCWLGALESLRLVLGTQLDVTEETYTRELDPSDPDAPRLALYGWLSWLQEETIQALAAALPDDADDVD